MANGFFDIKIGSDEVATVNEIVSFDPHTSSVQVMEIVGYGAATKLEVGLGNVSVKGRCHVTKYWDTAANAWAWFMSAAATYNGTNNVLITKTCVDGTTVAWLWTNAKVTITVEEPLNLTTVFHIDFEGPAPALQP